MQRQCAVVLLIGIGLLLGGCASTKPHEGTAPGELVWPDPPQRPRIEYTGSIRYLTDIKGEPSFFGKLVQGLFGRSREKLLKPYGVAKDERDRLYVADTAGMAVYRFDLETGDAKRYAQFYSCPQDGAPEKRSFLGRLFSRRPKTAFASPIGVAVDRAGGFYVSDSVLQKVFAFDESGKCLRVFGSDKELSRPSGIAINKELERLYVTDTVRHKVIVYSLAGEFLFEFGQRGEEPGNFNFPTNIFIDAQGKVFVTDSLNFRVEVFTSEGEVLTHFGRLGNVSGSFNKPKGIAVDSEGHIYVVDSLFDNVQIFDPDGRFLLAFGTSGVDEGEFWLPSGIFIDERDNIYVSDSYNTRVQIFRYIRHE
jgi:DNA-binding beta-propeller fold protein YncE